MRTFFCLVCLLLLFNSNSVSYSQKLSYGIYSGVNFSDIHGQDNYGRWYHKPGPVQGISLEYSFNRYLGIQTGLNFSTIYYEAKTYNNGYINFYPLNSYPYPYPFPDFYSTRKMDFSFLRVPLLLNFSIPSALRFDLKAGLFYSYLTNSSISNPYEYPDPVKNDLGYIFSSVISCPQSDNFRASLSIGYSKGWH
ncbi:MAG: outer membrane beta-barrel protein [Bacteroidales bacterium]|nr:outer membrane beta-barrel protein [Bacteroidales bacterium]